MKSVVKILSIAVATMLALGSCNHDKIDYVGHNSNGNDNIGYLALAGMQASVLEETENVESSTRAEGVDISSYDVTITNKAGQQVKSFKYGELPTEPIALEAGVYIIAMSSNSMKDAAWEAPVYAAQKEVIIQRKQTTIVDDFVCTACRFFRSQSFYQRVLGAIGCAIFGFYLFAKSSVLPIRIIEIKFERNGGRRIVLLLMSA
jgi:hypothetical protein